MAGCINRLKVERHTGFYLSHQLLFEVNHGRQITSTKVMPDFYDDHSRGSKPDANSTICCRLSNRPVNGFGSAASKQS